MRGCARSWRTRPISPTRSRLTSIRRSEYSNVYPSASQIFSIHGKLNLHFQHFCIPDRKKNRCNNIYNYFLMSKIQLSEIGFYFEYLIVNVIKYVCQPSYLIGMALQVLTLSNEANVQTVQPVKCHLFSREMSVAKSS